MSLEEFIENCNYGVFTNYDGIGAYVKDGMMYGGIFPSDVANGNIDYTFPQVIWFNK